MSFIQQCRRGTWSADLLGLVLIMVLLFGLFLGSRPLSVPDEARYAEIPREMLALHDFVTPHLNGVKYLEKPPLFYWTQAASIKLFSLTSGKNEHSEAVEDLVLPVKSISEWVVRLPNACIALLDCLFLYGAARLLFDRQTGLVSSIVLATSLLYFALARMVTLDMCLSVCLSGSLLAFLVAVNFPPGSKRRYLCYVAYSFSALAVLTKGLVGIVFPVVIIGLWILLTYQWRLLKQIYLPSGILLFLLIVVPWHILVQHKNPEFFQFYFVDQQFLRYATLIARRYKPSWFFIPVLIAGFLPWIVFLLQAIVGNFPTTQQQLQEKSTSVFLLLWIMVIFIFFSFSHSKLIPYILPIFPALALLTGNYLSTHFTQRSLGIKWGIIALPFTWLVLGILGILWLLFYPSADLPRSGIPFVIAGYSVFLLTSVVATFFYKKYGVKATFILLVLGSAISFIIFSTGIPQIDTRSIKPFVQILKPLLQPHDKITSYKHYYQDLPFYLNHRVLTVDVTDELNFGMQHQDTASWMLPAARFWSLWHSRQRVFMITDKASYQSLKEKQIYLIASTPHDVLLSNQFTWKKKQIGLTQKDSP
jgi:4-amino-4-deoxy-L-arabinose transferase-like glycosyltransferase